MFSESTGQVAELGWPERRGRAMLPAVSASSSALPAPVLRRQRRALSVLVVLVLTLVALLAHAAHRRAARRAGPGPEAPWVRALPSPSLVLSTRSRWLRHPLLAEPGAAFQDGPAFLDADPAGALQSPPRDLFRRSEAP